MHRDSDGRRSRNRLLNFLRQRTPPGEEAEDIVQEAYARLEAYSHRAKVEDGEKFLWRTAFNLSSTMRRRAAIRDSAYSDAAVADLIHPSAPPPDEVFEMRERLRIVEEAIAELPERCRAVFIAVRIDGLTYSAAAQAMGISQSAVEKHMARAIAQLTLKVHGFGRIAHRPD